MISTSVSRAMWADLLEALPEGVEVLSNEGDLRPVVLRVPRMGIAHLYCWILSESGTSRAPGECKIELKLPGQKERERRHIRTNGLTVLILGYSLSQQVFVSWEARHHVEFAYNANVQISKRIIETAQRQGFACAEIRKLRGGPEARVACRRERLLDLVRATHLADKSELCGESRLDCIRNYLSEVRNIGSLMPGKSNGKSVEIRPRVEMYGAFARLNYRPWYAIAEFIDNSIQSYVSNKRKSRSPLRIEVNIDEDVITIRDNAFGIAAVDFERAFSPAQRPPDDQGLSEFGIGMKAAACWFADQWSVRTQAQGELIIRTINFDVPKIVKNGIEQLRIDVQDVKTSDHFTAIRLQQLRVHPKSRTISKIRSHLASIYREFLRSGDVEIIYRTASTEESIRYKEPTILEAARYNDSRGEKILWRKAVDIDLGKKRRIFGWAGILAKADTARGGLSIFRRNRLIQGSDDTPYRPHAVFGAENKFRSQRIIGELHLNGFSVSHTKDGIQWGDLEDDIGDRLRDVLDSEPLPLLRQAENYRARKPAESVPETFGRAALQATSQDLAHKAAPIIDAQLRQRPDPTALPVHLPASPPPTVLSVSELVLELSERRWRVSFELVRDPSSSFYVMTQPVSDSKNRELQHLSIRLNLQHPFSERYIIDDEDSLQPVARLVASLAIAEITARESGVRNVGTIRRRVNEILAATATEGADCE